MDEDVIRDIEIKMRTVRDEMHIEHNKDKDIICSSDTVSMPALTASSHNSQSTNSRQMPGLIASSCDSQTTESTMDDIQKIQSLMSTSQKKKTRASRRKNEDHQKHAGTQSNSNNSYSSQLPAKLFKCFLI